MKTIFTKILAVFCILSTFVYAAEIKQNLKVHPFVGAVGTVSNILEFDDFLILVDTQVTQKSEKALNSFMETLNKPLKAVILATHPITSDFYKDLPIYSVKAMDKFIEENKTEYFVNFLTQISGGDIMQTATRPNYFLEDGKNNINGVNFIVEKDNDRQMPEVNFEIEGQNVYFTHQIANNSHYLIYSKDEIKPLIKKLKKLKKRDYAVILSPYFMPADQDSIDFSIKYLETVKSVLDKDLSKEGFIAEMTQAYPEARLEVFLHMSADFIYR